MIAIYNVFDAEELLEISINNIKGSVDEIICVVQTVSNHGNTYEGGIEEVKRLGLKYILYKPDLNLPPWLNEIAKRNIGMQNTHTHYIHMDCDEMYFANEFNVMAEEAKKYPATVASIQTYFKSPLLTIGRDNYFVPFVCKKDKFMAQRNKCGYYVDPTRDPGVKAIELPITMHHYSYVRKDIMSKVDINTAKANILKSSFETDWTNAREGYGVGMYQGKTLKATEDYFDILQRMI